MNSPAQTTIAAPLVIKIGGHEIADPDFLTELAATVHMLETLVIIVHGGGKEISDVQRSLGIEPRYVDGLRITDAQSLAVVQMVLAGLVNKRLVAHLMQAGVDAVGLTGVDHGIVRARQMPHPAMDMAFTGEVTNVRGEALRAMLADGLTPVIAPLCLGDDSRDDHPVIYNVNADHVAGAVGAAVGAAQTVFLTNVSGVMANGTTVDRLAADQANALIADGTIDGGMIPKVRTALDVLARGVPQAVITNLTGLKTHGGTVFSR
ncbi:MAG: acetylglutamate kinase [Chloroflexota bacterium]